MTDGGSARPARQPRPRRKRGLRESLLSIVLLLEAIVAFFIALTVFGLHALPPVAALGGGALLALVLLLATRVQRYSWGVWIGWVLQLVLVLTGIILPALYVVAALFLGLWIFCFVRAVQLEGQAPPTDPSLT